MNPHFVVTLAPGSDATLTPPYWQEAIADKGNAAVGLTAPIAALLTRFGLPVWTTHEYRANGRDWSPDERASGLDRIYRLILRQNRKVSPA